MSITNSGHSAFLPCSARNRFQLTENPTKPISATASPPSDLFQTLTLVAKRELQPQTEKRPSLEVPPAKRKKKAKVLNKQKGILHRKRALAKIAAIQAKTSPLFPQTTRRPIPPYIKKAIKHNERELAKIAAIQAKNPALFPQAARRPMPPLFPIPMDGQQRTPSAPTPARNAELMLIPEEISGAVQIPAQLSPSYRPKIPTTILEALMEGNRQIELPVPPMPTRVQAAPSAGELPFSWITIHNAKVSQALSTQQIPGQAEQPVAPTPQCVPEPAILQQQIRARYSESNKNWFKRAFPLPQ